MILPTLQLCLFVTVACRHPDDETNGGQKRDKLVFRAIKGNGELLTGPSNCFSLPQSVIVGEEADLRDPQLPPAQHPFQLLTHGGLGFILNIEIHGSKRFGNPWGWSNHLGVRFLNC